MNTKKSKIKGDTSKSIAYTYVTVDGFHICRCKSVSSLLLYIHIALCVQLTYPYFFFK